MVHYFAKLLVKIYKKNYNYISFDNYETIKKIVIKVLKETEKVFLDRKGRQIQAPADLPKVVLP